MKRNKQSTRLSTEERERLILDHCGLVKVIARQIHLTLPTHVEVDDLIQAGTLGLIDAAEKFDPAKQIQFAGYAKFRIRGAILDGLRQLDIASRELRRRSREINNASHLLQANLQREPTEAEIAEHLKIDLGELRKFLQDGNAAGLISISHYSSKTDAVTDFDLRADYDTQPDRMLSLVEMHEALELAMESLRPRHRQVVRAYYLSHQNMKEIASSMGINESRVSQLHKSALATLQVALQAQGVQSCGAF